MICADAQGLDATVDDLGLVWALSLHNRDSMAEVFQLAKIFEDHHIKKSIIHQCGREESRLQPYTRYLDETLLVDSAHIHEHCFTGGDGGASLLNVHRNVQAMCQVVHGA